MKNIPLKGISNAKDLGGIRTADGKTVREKKLIKSGALHSATPEDIQILTQEYGVNIMIDVRTKEERRLQPDPVIRGVSQLWIPLFTEDIQGLGLFTQEEKDILEKHLKALFIVSHRADAMEETAMEEIRNLIRSSDFDPEAYMARMYHKFVNNQVVQRQVKQFFSVLGNHRGGAILWHCGAGKDRSGICTALLLYALGVSKETIIAAYAESAESSEDAVDYLLEKLFPASEPGNLEYQAIARRIFGTKTCYIEAFFNAIEKDFVSIDNYLQKALEVYVDKIVRLKTLYLEP